MIQISGTYLNHRFINSDSDNQKKVESPYTLCKEKV
jgi:hypothetical protein